MTPMEMFFVFVGVCAVSGQLTRLLVWVDEPAYKH